MRVLMFGWEFPPHISGGLGTACYGLSKGLKAAGDIELLFVIPKMHGDEDSNVAQIIGANNVQVKNITKSTSNIWKEETQINQLIKEVKYQFGEYQDITLLEVTSMILPYLSPEQFEKVIRKKNLDPSKVFINREGKLVIQENGVEKEIKLEYSDIVETDETGKFQFTGKYGTNLYEEVAKYAEVAGIIAQQYDFDIIHAHDWLTYYAGARAKEISGKPLVIHVHATEFDRSGETVNQRVYDIERFGMDHADHIITVSNLTKNTVIERYGQNPNKITTVYNAVEPSTAEKKDYPRYLNDKIVTFLGRVTFQKGPEYFVEAAYKVLQRMDNVRFVMAGSGDLLRKMIRRAAKLKIADRFHFTDFLKGDDVNRMFAISDVYVMPSVSEPFGISPLEAMRSNVPVIISKQSGVAEILKHAIKIDFWDVDAMADAIHALLEYQSLSKMFAEHGKEEVDNLKWENAALNVKAVYEKVLFN